MSTSPADGPRTATRAALDALASEPARLFIAGGIGSGKSTVLEAVRRMLREKGERVLTRIPGSHDSGAAIVIDDAHQLTAADLQGLAELAYSSPGTIVVAAEPRSHDPALRRLAAALEREHPRITLGALTSGEISRMLTDPSGHPPTPGLIADVLTATTGIAFLVAALAGERPPTGGASVQSMVRVAELALLDRLRSLDQPELEALAIASLSTDLGSADLAAALGVSAQRGIDLVDKARGTGLLQPSSPAGFIRSVHRAVAHLVGATRHHELETALLRTQLASDTLSLDLALQLADHGIREPGLAQWLRDIAARRHDDPETRVAIGRAAVAVGAEEMRLGLADALALNGDGTAAAALADELLGSAQPAERAAGVRIAASVAARNGNAVHAVELFDWLGPYPDATVASAAALIYCATGDLPAARAALDAGTAGPPTTTARSARSLAEGIVLTIEGSHPTAAARLGQALAGEHAGAVVMPDSAAALATLVAMNSGDSARARSVIDRAIRQDRESRRAPLFVTRHRLLRGWIRMQDGQMAAATADAAIPDPRGGDAREALWSAALRTAIARRGGDTGALQAHWSAGMEALAEYSVDLFALLPLGELWVAGARLGRQERLAPALEQGFEILAALGEPAQWAPLFRWAGVHAGILAVDPAAVAPHGQALTAMAGHSPLAAALAAGGRTWLRVLAGQVIPEEVISAARGLAGFGLTSDATRLAGQAALQAEDAKVSGLMLQAARDLKLTAGADAEVGMGAASGAGPTDRRPRPAATALSDREREVAELLLLGMPYRDIGGQLYISAKTVEHHVARIRRRLGAESRSEMLSILRAMLAADEAPVTGI